MAVNYSLLWHLFIDIGMKRKNLRKVVSINTLAKLSKNEKFSISIIAKICEAINRNVEDVFEFILSQLKECEGDRDND